jgi:hypothetical protein
MQGDRVCPVTSHCLIVATSLDLEFLFLSNVPRSYVGFSQQNMHRDSELLHPSALWEAGPQKHIIFNVYLDLN